MRVVLVCLLALGYATFIFLPSFYSNWSNDEAVGRWEMDLANRQIDDLQEQISALRDSEKKQWDSIVFWSKQGNDLSKQFSDHQLKYFEEKRQLVAVLNAKESAFRTIHSCDCVFFVSIKSVSHYLDGYKVLFKIGNTSNVTFTNPKIKIEWNTYPTFDVTLSLDEILKRNDEWKKANKEKTFSIAGNLNPGEWSNVELFLSPCSEQELEYIRLSIEPSPAQLNVSAQTLISL